jgi:hypothetical protein
LPRAKLRMTPGMVSVRETNRVIPSAAGHSRGPPPRVGPGRTTRPRVPGNFSPGGNNGAGTPQPTPARQPVPQNGCRGKGAPGRRDGVADKPTRVQRVFCSHCTASVCGLEPNAAAFGKLCNWRRTVKTCTPPKGFSHPPWRLVCLAPSRQHTLSRNTVFVAPVHVHRHRVQQYETSHERPQPRHAASKH